MSRKLLSFLALALLLPLCGCRTYRGYDLVNVEVLAQSEEVIRTGPPSEIRIQIQEFLKGMKYEDFAPSGQNGDRVRLRVIGQKGNRLLVWSDLARIVSAMKDQSG